MTASKNCAIKARFKTFLLGQTFRGYLGILCQSYEWLTTECQIYFATLSGMRIFNYLRLKVSKSRTKDLFVLGKKTPFVIPLQAENFPEWLQKNFVKVLTKWLGGNKKSKSDHLYYIIANMGPVAVWEKFNAGPIKVWLTLPETSNTLNRLNRPTTLRCSTTFVDKFLSND